MSKPLSSFIVPALVAILLLGICGCSREAKKVRYLEQANRSFAAGKYEEAEINYKNVLQIDRLNPQAIGQLGLIYTEQGRTGQAIAFVVKGNQLLPENLELRLKLCQLYLATGNSKDARAEAEYILNHRPLDAEAPLFLALSATKPQDIANVRKYLEGLPPPAPTGAPVLTALSMLEIRQGHLKEAEAYLKQALAIDPKQAAAHAALGSLSLLQNNKALAEESFKQAAECSPPRSTRRIQYAQFKIQTGDTAAGKSYLEAMTRTTPDYLPAWTMLAELALQEKQYSACAGYIDKILARDPLHLEAQFLRGRSQLVQGNTNQALATFEQLLKVYPRAPQIHYQLGLAHLAAGNAGSATSSLKQALALAPGQIDIILALANLLLRTGDPSSAIVLLKPLVAQQPQNAQARLLLAEAQRTQKNYAEALKIYRQLEKDFPGNAQTSLMTGLVLLQQNQPIEARQAFTEALARAPGLVPALERLVALDVAEKQPASALQRIEAELARNPASAGAHLLLAKLCMLLPDTARAETEFRKVIELQPDSTEAYYLLARLYLDSKDEQKALSNLQSVVSRNPKDVSALMLIALIHEQQKNYPAARDAYEKLLAANPKFTAALNNIAYLYSEHFNEQEKAFAAAQKARDLLPHEPHVADTLGWILFKKTQYRWALSLLEESAAKLPDEPEVQYHLGLTRYMLGQESPARLALQHALDLNKEFRGIDEARRRLALLALDPETAGPEAQTLLEKFLVENPGDPIALTRLAALQERNGSLEQAIATQLKAVQSNPGAASPLINLARLYGRNKDTSKALETAKAARKLAPDDPEIARILGKIAYQAGDYAWSASLLQEAAQKITDDPELLFNEAEALYSIGRVTDAKASLRAALDLAEAKPTTPNQEPAANPFVHSGQATRFLEMIEISENPMAAAADRVAQELKNEPDYVPALMASGALHELRGDYAAARASYEKALARFPDFTPAKIRIATLASNQPAFDLKAYELAQQARIAYPNDPELAKALGILLYRKGGESSRAVNVLKQSAVTRTNDAELLFYLGMAQSQAKDPVGSRQSLQKSLDAGLRPDLAAEARKTLASMK
jgi:tetratricopeptide (TPR) repeat protein